MRLFAPEAQTRKTENYSTFQRARRNERSFLFWVIIIFYKITNFEIAKIFGRAYSVCTFCVFCEKWTKAQAPWSIYGPIRYDCDVRIENTHVWHRASLHTVHYAANTRQARSVKQFSIGIHVSLARKASHRRDEAIFPNFDDLQHLSVVHKAKSIVMSLCCAHKFF